MCRDAACREGKEESLVGGGRRGGKAKSAERSRRADAGTLGQSPRDIGHHLAGAIGLRVGVLYLKTTDLQRGVEERTVSSDVSDEIVT